MTDEPELDLNTLMSADPLSLSKQDLDRIIAYQRKQRAAREAGTKTKQDKGPAVDIKALLGTIGKPEAKPKISLQEAMNTSLKDQPAPQPPKPSGFIRRF